MNSEILMSRDDVPKSPCNNSLCVDLCENVHLHVRNVRLEFQKEEFLILLRHLKSLSEEYIEKFNYGPDMIRRFCVELPETTEFDTRMQVEKLVNGQYHFHYRNLRLEAEKLEDILPPLK